MVNIPPAEAGGIFTTHDPNVVARANRVITLSDSIIISDKAQPDSQLAPEQANLQTGPANAVTMGTSRISMGASLGMAVRSLKDNRFMLTLLGIVIEVASADHAGFGQ